MCIPEDVRQWRRQRGLTFIELIMFIVIVSIAVTGVLLMMHLATSHSADPQRRKQALAIAEALLEEVQGSRFTFCDPEDTKAEEAESVNDCATTVENAGLEAGNQRPFDNVNDYVSAYGTPASISNDVAGQPFPTGYTAAVTVFAEPLNGIASDTTPANTNVLRIRVAVTYGSDEIVLDGYRTRYAPTLIP